MAKIILAKDMGLNPNDKVKTDKLFLFFAYARSGHHAVVEYIGHQFKGNVFHLNFCDWNQDQWLGCKDTVTPFGNQREARLITSNYENFDLTQFDETRSNERIKSFVKGTPEVVKSVIVRDPYNHFYSWYNRQKHIRMTPEKYLLHAKEFLGETNYLGDNAIHVNYNKWCIDQGYRQTLFKLFNGDDFTDNIGHVPVWAGGSTIDNLNYQGKGYEMKVRERWRMIPVHQLRDGKDYLFNEEVIEYACKIHSPKFILPIVDALKKKL